MHPPPPLGSATNVRSCLWVQTVNATDTEANPLARSFPNPDQTVPGNRLVLESFDAWVTRGCGVSLLESSLFVLPRSARHVLVVKPGQRQAVVRAEQGIVQFPGGAKLQGVPHGQEPEGGGDVHCTDWWLIRVHLGEGFDELHLACKRSSRQGAIPKVVEHLQVPSDVLLAAGFLAACPCEELSTTLNTRSHEL